MWAVLKQLGGVLASVMGVAQGHLGLGGVFVEGCSETICWG